MSRLSELLELEKACSQLSLQNRQYVLAVANALKFTEESRKSAQVNKTQKEDAPEEDPDTS